MAPCDMLRYAVIRFCFWPARHNHANSFPSLSLWNSRGSIDYQSQDEIAEATDWQYSTNGSVTKCEHVLLHPVKLNSHGGIIQKLNLSSRETGLKGVDGAQDMSIYV